MLAGIAIGIALGSVIGVLGGYFLGVRLVTYTADILKSTVQAVAYSVTHPFTTEKVEQVSAATEEAFDADTDVERVPDWMDEEFNVGVVE